MAGGGHVRVNRLKLRAPIFVYTEHAQFVNVSYSSNYGGVFMRDSGCSLSCSLHPQQQFIYLRNYDVIYEIIKIQGLCGAFLRLEIRQV